jgi:hypothetical protein
MRIQELSPEKFYAVIVEGSDLAAQDAENIVKRFKADGINVVVLADYASAPQRYWGIWVSPPNGKPDWVRNGSGDFLYYPSPAIAAVKIADLGWEHCSVKEFTVADVFPTN